ncbi:MAG: PTS sugar transporter subunit IIC [Lactobacillus delbrueckii]|uniref:PTS sugar transporter subunit IIC n=1 Tax=Lactobacillus delbrueckii TaxID=1584 RepID=UPI0030C8569A
MSETTQTKETVGSFTMKVLNGSATAIIVSLLPSAILSTFLTPFAGSNAIVANLLHIVTVFQYFFAVMCGFSTAKQFNLGYTEAACVGGAAFLGSGCMTAVTTTSFQLAGMGDVINTMLTAAVAVLFIKWVGNRFGSLGIVFFPILAGTGVGFLGSLIKPYVSLVTTAIGDVINTFTKLAPYSMCILIAMSFAIIIVTPLSTVAISVAIGLAGMGSAAAGFGLASTAAFLFWATLKVDKPGVQVAIFLGVIKMMMPNFLRYPVIGIPIALTAAISTRSVPILGMQGTPASGGFGLIGAVSPSAAYNAGFHNVLVLVIVWVVVPFAVGYLMKKIFVDWTKIYKPEYFISPAR